jgi:hypothetical protein
MAGKTSISIDDLAAAGALGPVGVGAVVNVVLPRRAVPVRDALRTAYAADSWRPDPRTMAIWLEANNKLVPPPYDAYCPIGSYYPIGWT